MFRSRRLRYLPNVIRVAVFVVTVSTVLTLVTIRSAASHAREGLLSMGREMLQYADHTAMGPSRTLALNGASLQFASGSTSDALNTVLDFYNTQCAARDGVSRQLADLDGALPPIAATSRHGVATDRRRLSTLRVQETGRGYVACFDVGNRTLSTEDIVARVRAFAASGDLSAIGHFRYLYAERTSTGRTRFVGFWSDGEMNVLRMFPASGDVPGADPTNVPRIPHSRRLLSAQEVGRPYGMTLFRSTHDVGDVELFYREQLPLRGWSVIPPRGGSTDTVQRRLLTFERGNETLSIVLTPGAAHETTATLLTAE